MDNLFRGSWWLNINYMGAVQLLVAMCLPSQVTQGLCPRQMTRGREVDWFPQLVGPGCVFLENLCIGKGPLHAQCGGEG